MIFYAILPLISAFLDISIGTLVFLKNRTSRTNLSFFFLCISLFVWLFSYSIAYYTADKSIAFLWLKIGYTGVIFISPPYCQFVFNFLEKKATNLILFLYIASGLFVFSLWKTNYFVVDAYQYFWGYYPKVNFLHPLFLLYLPSVIMFCLFVLYKEMRKDSTSSFTRKRIQYVFWALSLGPLGSVDFFANYGFPIYPFGYIFITCYVLVIAYAILKYRLMDIRIAITRAGIFIVLYALILGIPFFIGITTRVWWLSTTAAVIVATIGPVAYRFLQKRTEDLLLAQQRRYQKILLQASVGMIREHNLNRLSKLLVYVVNKTVKLSFTTIFLDRKDQQLFRLQAIRNLGSTAYEISFLYEHPFIIYLKTKDAPFLYEEMPQTIKDSIKIPLRISLIVPFSIDNTLLGFTFLGEKLNKQPYSEDDINVFRILAHQVAMAISNCLFFVEFKNAQEKIFNAEKLASIGGMADGIAHQIKNRLNHFSVASGEMQCEIEDYIKNHPQLMDQNPDLKKSFEYVHQIADSLIKNVKHTDSIIKGILNFARTEEKETFFNYFSLGEVINLALQLLKVKHEIQEFPLKANLGDNDLIFGVKSQIMEAIYNILDNCFEALMEKKGRLSAEERERFIPLINLELKQTDSYSQIVINDNGIGIKEEDKHKIFAPFFTTKSSYKSGSGIGMYVVKRMIEENHHGKIAFQSTYLEGVKFRIELPTKK